ncbi:Fumarylacetoacetate hydrolase domain-containing protein 2 [Willisornis vidua]|uniref:Fumarylacetoacetate hydrolase domain-containing protein 2 n=1 Tax=Willisornis vidua TaxID=1566151 RepID=A0ABQ9E185_9PASS|nr:Fumarylacetoacetate hydrolase domain-containing protein 2 [Willisornis vidua]
MRRMRGALRLVRFRGAAGTGGPRLGLEEAPGGDLVDLSAAEPELPRSMREFLELGPRGLELAQRALDSGQHRVSRGATHLLAPVGDPEKVICVGLNYRDHCLEQDVRVPKEPLIFSKFPSAITGPFDDIVHPQDSTEVDWEAELAAVIGKKGRHIEESVALEHVVGFTVANDVSARDWQMRRNGRQWLLGKTFDTFCPLGPAIVTREAVAGGDMVGVGQGQNRNGDGMEVDEEQQGQGWG